MRALVGLCGALAAAFAGAAAAPASLVAITHVTVIDMTGAPPKPDMTVIIKDQHIGELGKSDAVHAPAGARLVDGSGDFLIPGLWDMHVHEVFGDWIPRNEKWCRRCSSRTASRACATWAAIWTCSKCGVRKSLPGGSSARG